MNAAAIIIIAIAASGVLMMRFRKRWLAKIKYRLSAPNVVHDPTRRRFPLSVRVVLRLVGAAEYMELSTTR